MRTTLVLPDAIHAALREVLSHDVETGAVLLVRPVPNEDKSLRLLAVRLLLVPDEAYEERTGAELVITSDGYVPALGEAEEVGAVPIWLHTHPFNDSSPRPSRRDRRVDRELADLFRLRSGSEYYGALILAMSDGQLRFTGHLDDGSNRMPIDRLFIVGPRLALAWNDFEEAEEPAPIFDRNVRAFGGGIQRVLSDLFVAVVGCGGTGSAVAEQLVRLGVRRLHLIDPDKLTDSNITRVYGSTPSKVGRWKVDVLADHLRQIAPDAQVTTAKSTVTSESAARRLASVDIAFGCTDDNAGRLVLSRVATYLLVPVVDCGVLLSSDSHDQLIGIDGRVTLLYPGAACLVCRDRIDLGRAGSEMLHPDERSRRVDEGYAPALGNVEPAVVAFTTLVAATAVSELLERFVHYGPGDVPSEILLRVHDREISTNRQTPSALHYCDPQAGKLGLGLTEPFLEQTWAA